MDLKFIGSRDQIYQGTRNDFMFNPVTKDLMSVSGIDYVKQKVIKVLLTSVGLDVNFPSYGTSLDALLFENLNDPNVQENMKNSIIGALTYTETQETSLRDDEHIASIDALDIAISPEQQSVALRIVISLRNNQTITVAVGS